jgi:phosphoadenosine phosphosulfate reductase
MNTHVLAAADAEPLDAAVQRLSASFAALDLDARLAAVRREIAGRIVFTTSFGLEDQAIAHAIFSQDLPIDVVTLDTGRLFPQTYELWSKTEARYGRRIRALYPERCSVEAFVTQHGIDGFRSSIAARQACCGARKVEPLGRALDGAAGWITGVRAEQSWERAATPYAAVDAVRALVKVNPLFDWTRERVVAFVREQAIPYNPLHDEGFLSIGCAPCTRAVKSGESERAGRWWWEQDDKKECGLHNRPRETIKATVTT